MRKIVPDSTDPSHGSSVLDLPALDVELKKELVDRIVVSPSFSKSDRLITFLLHVCELERTGRSREICEQHIGEAIFGRSENYDPTMDSIVRSHASRLRLRLEQYFAQEGAHETIRVRIPRGAYVPYFEPVLSVPVTEPPPLASGQTPHPPDQPSASAAPPIALPPSGAELLPFYRKAVFVLPALLTVLLAIPAIRYAVTAAGHRQAAASPSDVLWSSLFSPGRETFLVVGDGGANIFENITRRQLSAEEYSSKSWLKDPIAQTPAGFSWAPIPSRTYTPYFATEVAIRLARLPQVADGQLSVLFARDMRLDNLKDGQAILLGSSFYNPWEQLLTGRQNFLMTCDAVENSISIVNQKPLPGEPPVYKWSQTDTTSHSGYSLITLTTNLNGNGRILLIQGTTAQGDRAAGEFLFNRPLIEPVLRAATTRDGKLNDFEMVLETNFVAGGNVDTRIVASRIHAPHA